MIQSDVQTIVNGTFEIAPADQSRFFEIVRDHLDETRREVAGCVFYSVAIDIENPALLHLVEGWTDREALERHLASPRLHAVRARMSAVPMSNYRTFIYSVSGQEQYTPTAPPAR